MHRRTLICLATLALAACTDVRDATGTWHGPRVGDAAPLKVGVADTATATLDVTSIDKHGMAGTLTVDGICNAAPVASLAGAEADVLSGITFAGSPLRVYLAFVPTTDGGGDALAVIALFDGDRIEVRVLRGGATPLYGVFALRPM
jgi:hypothetical protein